MTRDVILWLVFVAAPTAVLARVLAWREERPAVRPRTVADTLAEQNLPSNVIPLRAGPNRKRSA